MLANQSKTKQYLKIGHFIFMFPLTLVVFQSLTRLMGSQTGFLVSFVIYWLMLFSFSLYYFGLKGIIQLYKPTNRNVWWNLPAFVPVIGTFIISFLPTFSELETKSVFFILIFSIANGFCEELFWRGLTLKNTLNNKYITIVSSLAGFGLWHFSLAFCDGIVYQGGWPALVGGAFFMGIIWQIVAIKTNKIGYVTLAHILTNVFAFSRLFLDNFTL